MSKDAKETVDLIADNADDQIEELDLLREILAAPYRERIAELEEEVIRLEGLVGDEESRIEMMTPIISDAIQRNVNESRAEMVEALYPLVGQLVMRAVSEAIQDLAREVDERVRTSFDPDRVKWRFRALVGGASPSEMALREALPFSVRNVFLIYRESGILIGHVSSSEGASDDLDLISGMLTAIRAFAADVLGEGAGELEEIEYGDQRILLHSGRYLYMALVVDGTQPPGTRAELRRRIDSLEREHEYWLSDYAGDERADSTIIDELQETVTSLRRTPGSGQTKKDLPKNKPLSTAQRLFIYLAVCIGILIAVWVVQRLMSGV